MNLKVERLIKTFMQGDTKVEVLKGANLNVASGTSAAIVGQSGSGKSTLLALLAGLDRPNSGNVYYNDSEITQMSEETLTSFRSKNLSIIFQQFHLMPNLTALENVSLPLEIANQPNYRERALQTLEEVGLKDRLDHFPHQLSGGENQRVAIARAFVTEPSILLADEPTGNLDDSTGNVVFELLQSLVTTKKTTMILVTHNLKLASACNYTHQIENGTLTAAA